MNTIFLTRSQFMKLKKHKLEKNINNTEATLYLYHKRGNINSSNFMLKQFYIKEGEYFSNKLFTLNNLIDNRSIINLDNLVLPFLLVVINGTVSGYLMPYIKGPNLLTILQNPKIEIDVKLDYLRQVGQILENVANNPELNGQFSLGDVHEGNFVIEEESNKVYAVDLDSCKIKNNLPSPAKYLVNNPNLEQMQYKYPKNQDGIHLVSQDTDILCYICMILNTISKVEIYKLPLEEYFIYLDYLEEIGFGPDFVNCCRLVYTNAPNLSPLHYLDQIPQLIGRASYAVFKIYQEQMNYETESHRKK